MKYHNLKRIFAGFMAAALTLGTTAFVASAEDTSDVTYYLNGYRDGNDYVLSITAQGGLINVGALEIEYNTDAFEDVELTFSNNIKDAGFYMGYDGEIRDGKAEIAFMSAAGLDDDDASLFATNPSTTIAYIDATGSEPIDIAYLRFTFGYGYSYDSLFVRGEAEGSENSAEVKVAKAILHSADGYAVDEVAATAEISNMLVFTAADFTLGNLETVYNGKGQTYTVTSDVAASWDICVGDNADSTVTDAGEYRVFLKDVTGEGYYDAIEVEFTEKFVIKKADEEITAPANPDAVKYVAGGFDLADLEIEDWTVTSEGKVEVGTHTVNVKYTGEFDTKNYNYTFEGEAITSAPETTVTLTVNPAEGDVPSIEEPDAVTYNPDVAQTVAGYGIELDKDWEFVDVNTALVIGENKDIAIKFVPDDVDNYTYEGFDAELGYVPGKVTVTLNKAKGTGPESPNLVREYRLKADQIGKDIPLSEFGDLGVWETVVESIPGETGTEWFTLTYTPKDLDKYDYSEEPRWVASANRFEYQYFVTILPAYLPSGLVPPANPEAKTFTEEGFKYSDFALTEGWTYAEPNTAITTAGEHKDVKVLYDIPDDFTANPEDGYTVEDGKIVSYVTITVNKIALPTDKITFTTQNSVYTGNAIEINKANLVITDISGVDADDVTLIYEEAKTAINAGTYKVYATVAATDNYEAVVIAFEVGAVVVAKADVTKDMFTVTNNSHIYDGTAKSATVTAKDGVSAPVVTYSQENPTVVGEYTITVTGDESANYKAYTLTLDTKLVIEKETIDIKTPANPNEVDYVEGGYDLEKINIKDWDVTSTGKVGAGTHEIDVVYTGTFDTVNYNYTFNGAAVTSAPETTVTLTVNKIDLPEDAFTAEKVEAVYDGTAKEITVKVNDKYTGVGQYTIEYSAESVVNAGKYTAFITFAAGTNYLGLTFELADIIVIAKADVAKEDITLANTEYTYDGTAKKATATAKDGMGVPTVTGEGTNAGSYTVTVAGDETTNYNAYTFTFENALVIKKADVVKADITVANTEYTYDGTAKKATATAKEGMGVPTVAGEGTNAGTYSFTVAGEATTNYNAYSFTYENALVINKADVAKTDITLANTEFTYDGTAKKATATAKDGVGAPTVSGEGTNAGSYTVTVAGDATTNYNAYSFTYENALVINKAALPADAATATAKTAQYTGSAITVDVVTNEAYTGLGTFTVAYPYGNIVVGKYTATATFAEGDNYLGGTVTFNNILVIEKAVLQAMDVPVIADEMYVDTVLSGAADDNGWKYDKDYTIIKGTNTVTVYKTIGAQTAMNWDFSKAASDKGATVTELADGSVMLAKVYTITGKVKTGKFTISATTVRAVEGESDVDDIIVTITPENGEAFILDSSYITEVDDVITISDVELEVGIYTITVKKMKYLTVIYQTSVIASTEDVISMQLTAGDIVGGEAGKETMGDGVIDIDDFVIAIRAFDTSASAEVKAAADIDEDGSNNVADLGFIKANFNETAK